MHRINVKKALSFKPSELLVERFCTEHKVSKREARKLFSETKKFLILCAANRGTGFAPSEYVDKMWHEFILFSRDYVQFCEILGIGYLHHEPSARPQPNSYEKTFDGLQKMFGKVNLTYWANPSKSCCNHCSSCKSVGN